MSTPASIKPLHLLSATLFIFSIAQAGRPEQPVQPESNPNPAILSGRVTDQTGAPLANVRVRIAIPARDMRLVRTAISHRELEARSNDHGEYRLEIPGLTNRATISIDALKPGYERLAGSFLNEQDERIAYISPGRERIFAFRLHPSSYFRGIVVDEQGSPISSVRIDAYAKDRLSGAAVVERTMSADDGSFELFNYPATPPVFGNGVTRGAVSFSSPNRIESKIDDIYAIPEHERSALRIIVNAGRTISGTVLDANGKPVPKALIKVSRKDGTERRATITDAAGKFALRGLKDGLTKLSARAMDIQQVSVLPMALKRDVTNLEIRLKAIKMPDACEVHTVLGMRLADLTPGLQSAFDVPIDQGVLILDPGRGKQLLGSKLLTGDSIEQVRGSPVSSVREFVNALLDETATQKSSPYRSFINCRTTRLEFEGRTTILVELTKSDREELQKLAVQLNRDEP